MTLGQCPERCVPVVLGGAVHRSGGVCSGGRVLSAVLHSAHTWHHGPWYTSALELDPMQSAHAPAVAFLALEGRARVDSFQTHGACVDSTCGTDVSSTACHVCHACPYHEGR